MDHGACNVIYLDRRAQAKTVRRDSVFPNSETSNASMPSSQDEDYFDIPSRLPEELRNNIQSILTTFNEVHLCQSGSICLDKLAELQQSSKSPCPTVLLIDVPYDEEQRRKRLSREPRTPSPTSFRTRPKTNESLEAADIYGVPFLTHISAEIHARNLSRMIVPVVVLSGFDREWAANSSLPSPSVHGSQVLSDTFRLTRYLDNGAVDVLASPMSRDSVQGLAVHAYRIYKEVSASEAAFMAQKRNRKLSWVGVDETKPYAYLREAMVSNLMERICNPGMVPEKYDVTDVEIEPDRKEVVAQSIGTWEFSAHDFTDDELLHAALQMLQHALTMPEVEKWRMSEENLLTFLMATRAAYNDFVLYHNFRHVVDVLQACFYSLCSIGALPPYPHPRGKLKPIRCPISTLIKPFDALTLLVAAIGHDVGHPGVNNAFLVVLNSPLAQLYNDQSVLESFHCAAYSQILRRHWPACFEDTAMRKLMINDILATDMGVHFKYMSEMGNLQEKYTHNGGKLDGWNVKVQEGYRDLICGLLIKCADISNVARSFPVAAQWASILTDEFSNQGNMEIELGIPTQLFGGPPVRDNVVKMGESQIGFINVFARPLFENVAKLLPGMSFAVDTILENERIWQVRIREEKDAQERGIVRNETVESGLLSPRSGSPARDASSTQKSAPAVLEAGALTTQPEGSPRPFTSNGHPVAPVDTYQAQRADAHLKPGDNKNIYLSSSSTTDVASAVNGNAKRGGTWKKIKKIFR
ncbi:hypothetical protein, variant [Verruconis gallopava]|uniref:Phosphodiesterase n=1 Tax=Verruconis gallopava TaxID=253628 RepID=A0A0D1XCZ7_9PEZI|nr:uncharacterized protein PV09_08286 [Verruconis gallopava]XP_016209970.1 hypothetical protein, variant [Verruconis gallopava]KIW00100.1 hypothetical protein PV09_08286 [Verruconis gallopava]KIW00101.1 hypothetical protein, variant [Verruconis gallopava]